MEVEIVRGWDPASPVFTVTRAEGNTVLEIDGETATDWYRRFFTVDGALAPMPESAYRFPLIIDGPDPGRQGLYRSMQVFDEERCAVTYWGDVVAGDRVRLGIGTTPRSSGCGDLRGRGASRVGGALLLLRPRGGARRRGAPRGGGGAPRAAGIPLAGFFSFGEIGPTPRGDVAFYNQTAARALLREEPREHSSGLRNAILRNLRAHATRAYEEQVRALMRRRSWRRHPRLDRGRRDHRRRAGPGAVPQPHGRGPHRLERRLASRWRRRGPCSTRPTGAPLQSPLTDFSPGAEAVEGGAWRWSAGTQALRHQPTSISTIRDAGGEAVCSVLLFRDITERQLLHLQLAHQACHHAMTGLPNRQSFEAKLRHALQAARADGRRSALCYIDLDQFKLINDTSGHMAGDQMLREVAALLQ